MSVRLGAIAKRLLQSGIGRDAHGSFTRRALGHDFDESLGTVTLRPGRVQDVREASIRVWTPYLDQGLHVGGGVKVRRAPRSFAVCHQGVTGVGALGAKLLG